MAIRQQTAEIVVETSGKDLYEFTDRVLGWVAESGIREGLLTLHVMHTSASLLIQENADPEVQRDFIRYFARLVPDGDPIFRHTEEGPDDMAAHVRCALTSTTLSVPVIDGRPALGTWQGIFLFEHRTAPHRRRVAAHISGA
ncbi:MAG: YjbQ family protein [bacterium]|nr:YjbQ family protein [bacterium]